MFVTIFEPNISVHRRTIYDPIKIVDQVGRGVAALSLTRNISKFCLNTGRILISPKMEGKNLSTKDWFIGKYERSLKTWSNIHVS